MARAIWTGSISFGLVSIPVGLFSATDDHTIHFHQFERGTSDRVRNKRVNERTGEEIDFADIVKGADVGDGEHVIVEPDELEAIAPGRSRDLEITDFVDLEEIDPLYFQRTYWLAPTAEQYARPYGLLLAALTRTNRAAIGSFVMRGKQYLAAIRPDGDVLALETLHFADEVRDPHEELENLPSKLPASGKELDMAVHLVESMSGPWKPEDYTDTYRDKVEELIADKQRGRQTVVEAEPPDPTEMSDLLAALEESVEAARSGRRTRADRSAKDDRTAGDGTAEDDLANATKADLAAKAKELDIKGRSTMTRDELAEAIHDAS
ncbi:DNA end-binding protein Ku [Pseudonocardia thermophila]|uniref:Non-homologous end joining protein Ku n=1 Tax=Pseudonocardia thermophila TaxID=1848 RepID=A0A1M6T0U1_PSETH|nr:Ku protein [Pseudonocardia thermophila]SHK50554.1 DNA end-binding protein Ku [Pseudonocardia thermophila]